MSEPVIITNAYNQNITTHPDSWALPSAAIISLIITCYVILVFAGTLTAFMDVGFVLCQLIYLM